MEIGAAGVASGVGPVFFSSFARPKSATFTRPSVATRMFAGFTSRWRTEAL
jgi:hypothetical protein